MALNRSTTEDMGNTGTPEEYKKPTYMDSVKERVKDLVSFGTKQKVEEAKQKRESRTERALREAGAE